MIYANWINLALLSSVLIASPIDGNETVVSHNIDRDRGLMVQKNVDNNDITKKKKHRKLGGGSYTSSYSGGGIPVNTCLTESMCRHEAHKRGIPDVYFYSNTDFHHCGCFKKEGKQHMMWGDNCTNDADKATKITTGIQVRVWCDSDDWKDDRDDGWGGGGGGGWDDKQPTMEPTLEPTVDEWKGGGGGWGNKDGWDDPTASPTWDDDAWDGSWGNEKNKPSLGPTLSPTSPPTWNDDEWDKDGWGDGGGGLPSKKPSKKPSEKPTRKPSKKPTKKPTFEPTSTSKPTRTSRPTPSPVQDCNASPTPAIRNDLYQFDTGVTRRRFLDVLDNDTAAPGRTLSVDSARVLPSTRRNLQDLGYTCDVSGNRQRVRFRAIEDFEGTARCEYTACDGCKCGTALIVIRVGPESTTTTTTTTTTSSTGTTSTTTQSTPTTTSGSTGTTSTTTSTTGVACNPDNNMCPDNKEFCCLRDNGGGNDPIFICTPAIQRCQPGIASPNTCEASDPGITCGDPNPICCKVIPGGGATSFTCVNSVEDCPACIATGNEGCGSGASGPSCCDENASCENNSGTKTCTVVTSLDFPVPVSENGASNNIPLA